MHRPVLPKMRLCALLGALGGTTKGADKRGRLCVYKCFQILIYPELM